MKTVRNRGTRSASIQSRLLMLLLAVLIPVLLIQVWLYYEQFKTQKNEAIQANTEVARAMGNAFESLINEILQRELIIGLTATATPLLSLEGLSRVLIKSTENNPVVDSFSWVGPQGRVLSSNYVEWIGSQLADRSYFQKIIAGRDCVVSNIVFSWANHGPLFTIVRGIRDDKGALLGMVLASITPDNLDRIMAVKRSKGADICLFDRSGMLVYSHPAMQVTWEKRNRLNSDPLIKKALAGEKVAAIIQPAQEKDRRVIAYIPIKSIGWVVSAGRSEKETLKPVRSMLLRQGGLFLSVVFLSFITALVISRNITKPIRKLQSHALALGHRDEPELIELSGLRELENLAHAFNFMSEQVHMWIEQAEQRAREAEEGERVLDALMENIPEGIAIATGQDVFFQKVSKHGLQLLGCSREELENKPFDYDVQHWTFFHANGMKRADTEELCLIRAIRNGEIVRNDEWILERPNKERIIISSDAGPIRDKDGNIIGAVAVWRDISERKKVEQALQKAHNELEHKVRERTSELARRNNEFQELAAKTINAMENDRKALAQELHDSIAGMLTAIMYQIEGRISRMDQAPISSEMTLESILAHLLDAVQQTRRISKRLRPSILDDFGLVAAVKDAIGDFQEFFPKMNILQEIGISEESVSDEISIVLYRVLQEALNNIGKHSDANHVKIRLFEEKNHIRLEIEDDGRGFDLQEATSPQSTLTGFGLTSMKERVEMCKGTFHIHSEISKGTSIIVLLPLKAGQQSLKKEPECFSDGRTYRSTGWTTVWQIPGPYRLPHCIRAFA